MSTTPLVAEGKQAEKPARAPDLAERIVSELHATYTGSAAPSPDDVWETASRVIADSPELKQVREALADGLALAGRAELRRVSKRIADALAALDALMGGGQ